MLIKCTSFTLAYNVLSLCVRAGLDALSCKYALMPNRSTKLKITTSARMTQNECYALVAVLLAGISVGARCF